MFFNRSLRQMEPGRGRRAAETAPAVE
jgi:hypothetical protein